MNGTLPLALSKFFSRNEMVHQHGTRNVINPHFEHRRTQKAQKALKYIGPSLWYQAPLHIREVRNVNSFTKKLKSFILNKYCQF